jgi:heat shock protein HslJ
MRLINVTRAWASVLAAGLVLAACGSGEPETQQAAEDLWGRTFVSAAVTEDGEPRPLVPDTRIRVTFEQGDGRRVAGWHAGCNHFGADVRIAADNLRLGTIGGTEIGCSDALQQQDVWLAEFFGSDPEWSLSGDRFTLSSDATVIELKEAPPAGSGPSG